MALMIHVAGEGNPNARSVIAAFNRLLDDKVPCVPTRSELGQFRLSKHLLLDLMQRVSTDVELLNVSSRSNISDQTPLHMEDPLMLRPNNHGSTPPSVTLGPARSPPQQPDTYSKSLNPLQEPVEMERDIGNQHTNLQPFACNAVEEPPEIAESVKDDLSTYSFHHNWSQNEQRIQQLARRGKTKDGSNQHWYSDPLRKCPRGLEASNRKNSHSEVYAHGNWNKSADSTGTEWVEICGDGISRRGIFGLGCTRFSNHMQRSPPKGSGTHSSTNKYPVSSTEAHIFSA